MKDFKIISLKDEGIIYECLVCGDRFTDKSVKHLRTWHKHKPKNKKEETK